MGACRLSYTGRPMSQSKEKKKRKSRPRTKIPCPCFVCRGNDMDPRIVKDHASRWSQEVIQIGLTQNPVASFAGVEDVVAESQRVSVREVTQETIDLLNAYDQYFVHQIENSDKPLYTSDDFEDGDTPPTAGELVLMHLEWMTAFKTPGTVARHVP